MASVKNVINGTKKQKTNSLLLPVWDFVSGQALVVELEEENEELLSGGQTGDDRILGGNGNDRLRPRLTARDVEQVSSSSGAAIPPPTAKIRGTIMF